MPGWRRRIRWGEAVTSETIDFAGLALGAAKMDGKRFEAPQSDYEGLASETPEPVSVSEASGVKTPKQKSLRETLMMFRKNTKKQAAPSACTEAEDIQNTKYMQKEEERKEKQAETDRKEQELRMELLKEKIKLTKTPIHEKLLELMDKNPSCLNIF
ncbi:hypothetical protein AVEN_272920-1 [Araneus ventricosus]|uniref:Uncharacterized protein n=1 Tax=Araneus ventricosus TaxID=182803 RepID=A0A4Y2ING9_ARAVE|nr:hypothetical protein AVEN_32982-1 [Araneus ventricosus]GBO29140.1 hypothetical protein AVEN_272920-1 [Araneus ventricosus]